MIQANENDRVKSLLKINEPVLLAHHKEQDISAIQDRLTKAEKNEVYLLVCGEFKRGKSSLINAFLGEEVCPVDEGIATAAISFIKYGPDRKASRIYGDINSPKSEVISFDSIEQYVKGDSNEIDNTIAINIEIPSEKLKDGLVIVDTPGVGGLDERHLFLTLYALPKSDITVFVTDAGEPLSASEIDFYRDRILKYSNNAFVVLNKKDLKTKEELEALVDDTAKKLSLQDDVVSPEIIPVSSLHWQLFNKTGNTKFQESSNFEKLNDLFRHIVADYRSSQLKAARDILVSSLESIKTTLEFQLSQINEPDALAQEQYLAKLDELKKIKESLQSPQSTLRKKINSIIKESQVSVLSELNHQSILFSTEGLESILKKPEALAHNGGDWVLKQINLGLESLSAEVDLRIDAGFDAVNDLLGNELELEDSHFQGRITTDLTPAEKSLSSQACTLARNALPGVGIASLALYGLAAVCSAPLVIGLGSLAAGLGYVYKTCKDSNSANRIMEMRSKLSPQITICMNDLKSYVQQRFDSFNENLIDTITNLTNSIIAEMQDVVGFLKGIEEGKKQIAKQEEQLNQQINALSAQIKHANILFTNPFQKTS